MHTKRATTKKTWPIPRKGTKYIIRPSHNKKSGVPILIIMRDALGFVKTKKELKKILNEKAILVNNKIVQKVNLAVVLFDVISFKSINKHYRVVILKKGKINVEEIKPEQAKYKICSILDKKIVKGKKVQLNLGDGRNILADKEKTNIGDSLVIDLEKKKIEKIIPLKQGAKVLLIKGKHAGVQGAVKKIEGKTATVDIKEEEFNVKINELVVLE